MRYIDREPVVRFIDRKYNQITTGQYYISTIISHNKNAGLDLDGGVPEWKVDPESTARAIEICEYYKNNNISVTSNYIEPWEIEYDKKNFVLSKLQAAGIEVVTDKEVFDRILESQTILQKMTDDLSKLEELSEQLNKERSKTQKLEQTKDNQENSIRYNNYKDFIDFIEKSKEYIPVEKSFDTKRNYSTEWYRVKNRIPVEFSSDEASAWLVNAEISKGVVSPVIIDRSYTGVRFLNGSNSYDSVQKYFDDNHVLETFKKELRLFYEKRIAQEQKNQDKLIKDFEELKELNLSNKENQSGNMSNNMKSILIDLMNESAETFVPTVYSLENYKKIFNEGFIETPIETVKLGQNQFVKLCPANRNNLMLAIRRTLEEPSMVIEKDTFDEKTETFKPVHIYGKSFINTESNHTKTVESVIIFKEGENIAMSLHNKSVEDFIKQIITADDFIYLDKAISRAMFNNVEDSNVVKEAQEFLSSLEQKFLPLNQRYDINKILSSEDYIAQKDIEVGNLEITKENFDRYFNIFNRHKSYKDNPNKIASELFNYHVRPEDKDSMREWLTEQGYKLSEKNKVQTMVQNGNTYGFAHEGKIYLNPEIWNSEAAVHEYTHLWDSYTQRTNPELWQRGIEIFENTKLWEEVKADPNYSDIADNNDLVLSEVHARICGKMADKVLERILQEEGQLTKVYFPFLSLTNKQDFYSIKL